MHWQTKLKGSVPNNDKLVFKGEPYSFSFIFDLLKLHNLEAIKCDKIIHQVICAGIRTHDLLVVSLLPLPIDQDFHSKCKLHKRAEMS